MVNYIAKVTIYVNNQEEAKQFWTEKMGFVCHEQPMGPHFKWMEVRPKEAEKTSFVIYEKELSAFLYLCAYGCKITVRTRFPKCLDVNLIHVSYLLVL